ncbi:MAG: hypothetical protein HY650_05575 [Acidobacteria bacterium]|nr:hypothetical protein [Acidobacteriota bacterium]
MEMRINSSQLDEFMLEIDQVLNEHRDAFAITALRPMPAQMEVIKRLTISELNEILILLKMIGRALRARGAAYLTIMASLKSTSPRSADAGVGDKTQIQDAQTQMMSTGMELQVLVKALYEWLYHLSELLTDPTIEGLVPGPLLEKLERYSAFRSKVVTHTKDRAVLPMGALRSAPNFADVELVMTPFEFPEPAISELEALYEDCRREIANDEATGENLHERCVILLNNLDKFKDLRRGRIISFIGRFGAISPNVSEVAECIRDLTSVLVPMLVRREATQ